MSPDEILERSRRAYVPSDADRARVRRKVAARVGAAAFGGAAAGSTWLVKITLLVALGAFGAGYFMARRQTASPRSALPVATMQSAAVSTAAPQETQTASPDLMAPQPAVVSEARSAPPHEPSAAKPTPRAKGRSDADSLEAETALIADAQRAIVDHDFARALAKLDEHAKTFPSGVLTEERNAARILALCGAGRTAEGRSLRAAFLRDHPRSPMAARVGSACGDD